MLEAYREHVAERAAQNIPAKPLSAEQVVGLIELLKNPPADVVSYKEKITHIKIQQCNLHDVCLLGFIS